MATAAVEERQLLKSLRWWDGFTIALVQSGLPARVAAGAYGALGVMGATVLWGIAALVALLSVWIYSEPAMMFPGRSGGISLYANEGWRKYTTLVGPVATFGYWIGWSVVLVDLRQHHRLADPGRSGSPARTGTCTTASST